MTKMWHMRRLPKVRIFSKDVVQVKKANLKEDFALQMLFQRKEELKLGMKTL